jgi:hypothetical protein
LPAQVRVPEFARKNFSGIFVDGMFTTFVAPLFTNASRAIRADGGMSCV